MAPSSAMSHADPTPLRRAAYLLLVVSIARWGWAASRMSRSDPGEGPEAAHLAATVQRVDRQERAGRPLGDGERIDPNTADAVELDRLPGIGPSTVAAIVSARAEGPPFSRPEELGRVSGIGPATVERIRPWLVFGSEDDAGGAPARRSPEGPRRMDLNRAGLEELETLPRIGPAIAARIVKERGERPFSSVDDLARVRGIGTATVERLRSLVRVGGNR